MNDYFQRSSLGPEQIAAAIAAASEGPIEDKNNPPTRTEDWDDAIVSHSYQELPDKLAERRRMRGPQKSPTKEQGAGVFSRHRQGLTDTDERGAGGVDRGASARELAPSLMRGRLT